jgi:predicted TIM-barrel fold metal-dependent hydrolase
MWGNDYPHHDGTWPRSQEFIAKQFCDVPQAEIREMVCSNAERLYKLQVA